MTGNTTRPRVQLLFPHRRNYPLYDDEVRVERRAYSLRGDAGITVDVTEEPMVDVLRDRELPSVIEVYREELARRYDVVRVQWADDSYTVVGRQ